jgi:uncharacterized cupredoxin-like copper-binding protein
MIGRLLLTKRPKAGALIALGALIAGAALTGCGTSNSSAASSTGSRLEVSGTDTMKFEPETVHVKAGEAVTIVFKNRGIIVHDYISSGADQNVKLANVLGGREASGTFQATKPGTYQVLCQQPGHKEAGMVGKIIVE